MRVIAPHNSERRSARIGASKTGTRAPSDTGAARPETTKDRAARGRSAAGPKRGKPFSEVTLAAFLSNLSTLLNSGVPLIKALEALMNDESAGKAAPLLESLIYDIRSGSSFSAALSRHPDCFPPLVISLVRAGEAGGTLVAGLERIVEGMEKRRETMTQLRQALTYPAIVTVLGSGAVCFLMVFVVPIFEETYAKAGMTLPMITLALLAVSSIVGKTWWISILLLIAAILLYRQYRHHPRVRTIRDRALLRIPVMGRVIRTILVGRFVQAFGNLLGAGVSIKESLALTEQVMGHSDYAGMVRELQAAVARGEGIGRKLGEYRSLFPPLLTQMLSLGEKSGELGKMVLEIGHYIDKDLKRRTQQMSTLIEPIITVVMAVAIGTVALAIYLPIFDMFKQVQ